MAKLISKTYGDALLSIAVEEDKLDSFDEEVVALREVLKDNPDLGSCINNPRISVDDKLDIIGNVFTGRITDELLGFLKIIVEKNRFDCIDEILEYFIDEVKKLKGIGVAYVTTPSKLSDEQKKMVEAKLLDTTDFKSMEMHYLINEELIGGMQIRIGDRIVDSSVQTKIMKLKQDFIKIQLG